MRRFIRKLSAATHEPEGGQSLVEFGLILPFLAILTFGTLEIAIYLQQQSTMNAAAFLAARSASVLGESKTEAQKSLKDFTEATGFAWLANGSVRSKLAHGTWTYQIEAGAGRLSGLLSAFSNGRITTLDTMTGEAMMPLEYNAKKLDSSYKATSKPMTHFMVTYDSQPLKLPGDATSLDKYNLKFIADLMAKIPSGIPGMDGASFEGFKALKPGSEPFSTLAAVPPNPKARNDKGGGDSGQFKSSKYLGPDFESAAMADPSYKKPLKYNIKNLHQRFDTFDKAIDGPKGFRQACRALGKLTLPPTDPAMIMITAAKQAAAGAGTALEKGPQAAIKVLETQEAALFR